MPVLDASIVQLYFVGAERPAWAYLARVRLTYCLTVSSLIPILRATDFIGMPAGSAVGEAAARSNPFPFRPPAQSRVQSRGHWPGRITGARLSVGWPGQAPGTVAS